MSTGSEKYALERAVVGQGFGALDAHVKKWDAHTPDAEVGPWKLGAMLAWTGKEYRDLQALQDLVRDYLRLAQPPRPLCLAVFGPPGSGKSYAVKQIGKNLAKELTDLDLPLVELNLTQLASPQQLGSELRERTLGGGSTSRASVPLVFFDEFDAPLQGVPLGWLSWFLAPMQDGLFRDGDQLRPLKRAIYVFAGGTAARMADFGARQGERFRQAKGPDFVSRLRGYLDVEGPNALAARTQRRAVLIRDALERVEDSRTGTRSGVARVVRDALLEQLLQAGRYRHGARSLHAVLEMAAARSVRGGSLGVIEEKDLPPPHLLAEHVDLGPLDPDLVGGPVAMSGGGTPDPSRSSPRDQVWQGLARAVWEAGGAVSYGGHSGAGGLTDLLKGPMGRLPNPLGTKKASETVETSVTERTSETKNTPMRLLWYDAHKTGDEEPGPPPDGLLRLRIPADGQLWGTKPRAKDSLDRPAQLFRMRWMESQAAIARIALSGKAGLQPDGTGERYEGRMPGVLEEVLLSLIQGRPVYIIGGLGGCAEAVGQWLGLGGRLETPVLTGPSEKLARVVVTQAHRFQPGGRTDLPLVTQDAIDLLSGFAVGGSRWPDNGLSIAENRVLYAIRLDDGPAEAELATRVARIVELVSTGLHRRFGQA